MNSWSAGASISKLLGFLLVLSLAGSVRADESWPRYFDDALGRAVVLPARPQRIVAIFASNTEMLAAVGATDKIVGIEAYTRFPPEVIGKPLVGGRLGFSAEAIAALRPDLVVMTPARQAANLLLRPLDIAGIPALVVMHTDLRQVFANLRLMGQVTGNDERTEALLAGLEARLAAVDARLVGRARPRIYLETGSNGRGAFFTAQPRSYTADIVERAGATNVFAGLGTLTQLGGEAILRADPDIILVAGSPRNVEDLRGRPGWDQLRAVRGGNVYQVSRAELLIPGPRVVDGVEHVARMIHPQAFAR